MSSSYTVAATLVQDPEALELGGKQCTKIRVVDKAISKKAEDRFINAILHGMDSDTARRLAKGDQILLTGTLQLTSYVSKKTKQKVTADEFGFGTRILRVLKSPSFFEGGKQSKPDSSEGDDGGYDPTADLPASGHPAGPSPLDGIL